MWVRNEKKLNMHCSKAISKDTRAARSDCTQQMAFAKSGSKDHTTFFRAFDSVASSQAVQPKIDEKLVGNRKKSTPDRPKIDEQSILSRPGRPKSFWGRLRTCSERLLGTQMTARVRFGAPQVDEERPRAVQMRARAAPEMLQEP